MKNEIYKNAMDHLKFSDDFRERVLKSAVQKRRISVPRISVIAAVLTALLVTTAFAASPELRQIPIEWHRLGKVQSLIQQAEMMIFTQSEEVQGAQIHYLELEPKGAYTFSHGMLYSEKDGFLRITEDYQLERMASRSVKDSLEKGDRCYELSFQYVDSEEGIISVHKILYRKNDRGEILLNAIAKDGAQWPVYLNVNTGKIRDALPDHAPGDFEGRVCFAERFRDGILLTTILGENAANGLFWIPDGTKEPVEIRLPENARLWYVENETLYVQNSRGNLSQMNEYLTFQKLSELHTEDMLHCGLLIIPSVDGNLSILDAYEMRLYQIEGLAYQANQTSRGGYHVSRYQEDERIALVHWFYDLEMQQNRIDQIGLLDAGSRELRYLEIENGCHGYSYHWLDETRFGVLYQDGLSRYLCIYEFE